MAPKFGTSGLRGLVTELTPALVESYTTAFLATCPHGGAVHVGRDLRASSPALADWVMAAVQRGGVDVVDHGAVPTPALALVAGRARQAAIMVTGSHIPADRNGLKFYHPGGEIGKAEEAAIVAARDVSTPVAAGAGARHVAPDTLGEYAARYLRAFGPSALAGWRVGVYEHSSVARDVLGDILVALGAEVVRIARSEVFVPVDTEALDPQTRDRLAGWCREHELAALVSTDGDADRPMVTDAQGRIVPGDVLGPLTARFLNAQVVCTPVSSNSLVEEMGTFARVERTRIGSPFVIAAMEAAGGSQVVGYEANGGFLLGFEAAGPVGAIPPLMTRDCVLPIVAPLAAARAQGRSVAQEVAALPARFTAADRIAGIPSHDAQTFLHHLTASPEARAQFFGGQPLEVSVDLTDGLRVRFADETVVHLRPSGNAPEFRCYVEAGHPDRAQEILGAVLARLSDQLGAA